MTEAEWYASTDPQSMLAFLAGPRRQTVSDRKLRLFACACQRASGAKALGTHYEAMSQDGREDYPESTAVYLASIWAVADGSAALVPQDVKAALLRDIVNPFVVVERLHRPTNAAVSHCWFRDRNPRPGERLLTVDDGWLTPAVVSLARAAYQERQQVKRECPRCEGYSVGKLLRCPDCKNTGYVLDDTGTLDPLRLAVLSDALEEAGCSDAAILTHLRRPAVCPKCKGTRKVFVCDPNDATVAGDAACWACEKDGAGVHVPGCWTLDLILGRS